jgi:hypothetical protein
MLIKVIKVSILSLFTDSEEIGGLVISPAEFSRRQGPPSTTLPSALTRIRSEDFKSGQATPNGLTQKLVGSTGSYISRQPYLPDKLPRDTPPFGPQHTPLDYPFSDSED